MAADKLLKYFFVVVDGKEERIHQIPLPFFTKKKEF